jgi:hypothetical protein
MAQLRLRLLRLLNQFGTARPPLPQDLFVRNHFGVRIVGFFQALLDLRSEPSVVLGALHIIRMKSRNNCEPGRSLARGVRERLFQFVIHTEGKGSFRHGLKPCAQMH